ncbi:MAG: hypothetical protein MJH10_15030 [Epibacterium sp.]|nr:hypothetical protein [Epibacterium sp.]NQX74833.1 hypothetical protein [Epibacterium sp.]
MSNPLKKIVKGIKKVFKKVVKVVKKIVKSDIFKAVAIGAAIYFGAGAVAGMLKGGVTAGAGQGVTQASIQATNAVTTTAGAGAGTKTGLGAFLKANVVPEATQQATTGLLGQIGNAASTVGSAAAANPIATAAVLSTGGNILAGYGAAREAEAERRRREQNSETELNVYDNFRASPFGYAVEQGNRPTYATDRAPIQNTDRRPQSFYDNSRDKWSPVQGRA